MKCINCGLPLSPARNLSNCPRCGAALEVAQGVGQQSFNQGGWGNTGQQQNPWGQEASPNFNQQPFNQQPFNQQSFNQQVQFGGGFGQEQVQVTFPIIPKLLLLIDWKRRQPQIAVGKEFVREKNEHMAVNAERWVIANIRSKNIEDLVKRARGTSTTTLGIC